MAGEHDQNSDYHKSRQPGREELDRHVVYNADAQHSPTEILTGLAGLMRSASIGARCNAPVRAEGVRQMQQTHGNRSVQRQLAFGASGASGGRVTVQRNPMEWMWERFGNVGDVNNMVDAGSTAVEAVTSANAFKNIGGWGDVWKAATGADNLRGPGNILNSVADASEVAQVSKGAGMLGTGANVLGVGMGINDFINANDNYERVQAGADTAASAIGFLGPLGSAFSGGYSVEQLLNKTFGLSDKLSGVLQDWDPLGLRRPSIDELSRDDLSSLEESNPLMKGAVREELSERRALAVRMQNRHLEQKDAQKQKEFEKEMASYGAMARGEYQRPLQQPDPLTIRANVPEEVSMALP